MGRKRAFRMTFLALRQECWQWEWHMTVYINSQDELDAFIERSMGCKILAIDTEFLREKTYRPRLCLLQMATENEIVLVDPFEVYDLSGISELFLDGNMMKIVHSGRQDIEILYHEVGVMPWPLFDTQIAAAVLGYSQQIGYGPLVHAECGVTLDKLDSFSDWAHRPLAASQLRYAADDVIYLPQTYRNLRQRLEEKGRLRWLDGDFRDLVNPKRYEPNPYERYKRLKKGSQLNRRQMNAARELAAWRELKAESLDLPRKWVLTDEQIVEACKRETRTIDQLMLVRGMREKLSTDEARTIVKMMNKALDAPKEEWPEAPRKSKNERNVDDIVDLMTALVRLRARENDIAFQTLANHDALQAIARGHYEDVELLEGWRYDMIGGELLELLQGNIALVVDGRHIKAKRIEDDEL